ncbi:hypothetical protein K443DRAFT_81248 [Laccaria amethystina LaAM-08-1]|uniref:LysM domain-containing protein n=1 Tax=Laccaria amethystina LaAM-08-1 TaxID=1095629 RepID=A0A0C9XCZ2_9AGAR|nr:hypothetical protein K443DRAFT_81248 [Laccaria amethystina LaAM-08-1]
MYSTPNPTLIDRNTALCLACSASLPPKNNDIHITNCCRRPICPTCIGNNSRLMRYNPCLACLEGVDVIVSRSQSRTSLLEVRNLDGAVRDEETFVLGDDDDASDEETEEIVVSSPSPPYSSEDIELPKSVNVQEKEEITHPATLLKYYVARNDTLRGIALRLGVEGRELCRLNNLPPSTLSTTPHLLHTRTFIMLPHIMKSDTLRAK